jgi:hypothetical protein
MAERANCAPEAACLLLVSCRYFCTNKEVRVSSAWCSSHAGSSLNRSIIPSHNFILPIASQSTEEHKSFAGDVKETNCPSRNSLCHAVTHELEYGMTLYTRCPLFPVVQIAGKASRVVRMIFKPRFVFLCSRRRLAIRVLSCLVCRSFFTISKSY